MQFTDQTGFAVELAAVPQRIISLVPSQTELLAHLGLENETLGITRFCVHPENWFHSKEKVGGTKQFDFEKIHSIRPQLIIGNKEENYESGITELRKQYPVWLSDVNTVSDALGMIRSIGEMCGKAEDAAQLAVTIETCFKELKKVADRKRAVYFIWRKPYLVAASGTFIHAMLEAVGFENVFAMEERYPEVTAATLAAVNPDFIFLSTEPYRFTEGHFAEFYKMSPNSKVLLVDGEMFSWYGPRMLLAADYFRQLHRSTYRD